MVKKSTNQNPKVKILFAFLLLNLLMIAYFYLPKRSQVNQSTKETAEIKQDDRKNQEKKEKPETQKEYTENEEPSTISRLSKNKSDEIEQKKAAWAKLLVQHPYNNRPLKTQEEWKKLPKQDRPDLAAELDFLLTMDPATGQVPYERKIKVNETTKLMQRTSIAGINWVERGPNNVAGRTRALTFDPNDPTASKVWAGGVGGGLWYTNDLFAASPNWIHVDGFWDNIAVNCIAFNPANPQEIYVGTGEGWFNLDAQKGGGMWKSSDGGTTWNRLPSTDPGAFDSSSNWQYINKIVIKNDGTIFAATRTFYTDVGGIMRSTDGGANWTRVLSVRSGGTTPPDRGADLEIAANGDVYASFGVFSAGKVFKSLHAANGASGTWTDLSDNIGIANGQRIELACAPSDANIIYAIASGGGGGTDAAWFKKSTDGGVNWTNLTIPLYLNQDCSISTLHFTRGQAWYDLILAVHPTNPDLVIAGGVDLHRTTDGGTTWQAISYWTGNCLPYVHADQHAIEFRPGANNEIIVGTDGGVHYSSNAGNASATPTFTEKNTGYNITQFYACAVKNEFNSNYFLAGSQDNGTQKFTQPQLGSTQQVTGGDGAFCHIDQENSNIQITSFVFNSYFRSLNGGGSFTRFFNNQTSGLFINPTDYDSQRKILYCAANADSLRRISGLDGTITETRFYHNFDNARLTSLKISPFNDVLFVGTMGGRIFKVNNASAAPNFTRIDNGATPITTAGAVSCIEVGADDNHLLITFSNYGVNSVWETTDGGANWFSKEGNLPDIPVRWALFNPENRNEVLLATEVGIWSTNGFGTGTNSVPDWSPSNTNLANTRCTMLRYRPADKMVVVSTHGRGLFTSDVFVSNAVADFTADTKSTCNGSLTVQFTDASLRATSWAWDVDNDGITDYTTQNPAHTYNTAGIYSVSLTVNQGESTETKKDYIIVQNTSPAATTVCTNTLNLNNEFGTGIFRVKLANIDHTTPHNDGAYNDYSCSQSTQLFPNTLYQITVRTGLFNDEGAAVYIDYNDNGTFEVGELVTSFPANQEGERTSSFTTPITVVKNKLLRMRVVSKFEGIPGGACDTDDYGQAEDYSVFFTDTFLWNGTVSTDWNTAGNWTSNALPTPTSEVFIPNDAPDQPIVANTASIRTLQVERGAVLTLDNNANLTLQQNIFAQGEVRLIGNAAKAIPTTFRVLPRLTIDTQGAIVSLSENLAISENLTLQSGILNLNNFNIDLGDTGVLTENRSSNAIVTDNTPNLSESNSGGYLRMTNRSTDASIAEIAGSGLSLSNAGTVSIDRYHYRASGLGIKKIYQINGTPSNASMRIVFAPAELVDLAAGTNLKLFRQNAANLWENQGGTWVDDAVDYVELANINAFSPWTVGDENTSLPIRLLAFKARRTEGMEVSIEWQTVQERNNLGFEIEVSQEGTDFEKITFVEGKGNSNQLEIYEYRYNNPEASYYRLKQIDLDGTVSYSPIVFVEASQEMTQISLFPNPIKEDLTIRLGARQTTEVQVKIYNAQGQLLYDNHLKINNGEAKLNLSDYATGTYLIHIKTEGNEVMKKVIKQ